MHDSGAGVKTQPRIIPGSRSETLVEINKKRIFLSYNNTPLQFLFRFRQTLSRDLFVERHNSI